MAGLQVSLGEQAGAFGGGARGSDDDEVVDVERSHDQTAQCENAMSVERCVREGLGDGSTMITGKVVLFFASIGEDEEEKDGVSSFVEGAQTRIIEYVRALLLNTIPPLVCEPRVANL